MQNLAKQVAALDISTNTGIQLKRGVRYFKESVK